MHTLNNCHAFIYVKTATSLLYCRRLVQFNKNYTKPYKTFRFSNQSTSTHFWTNKNTVHVNGGGGKQYTRLTQCVRCTQIIHMYRTNDVFSFFLLTRVLHRKHLRIVRRENENIILQCCLYYCIILDCVVGIIKT